MCSKFQLDYLKTLTTPYKYLSFTPMNIKQIHSMNIEEALNQTSRNLELFQLNTANNQNYPFPL